MANETGSDRGRYLAARDTFFDKLKKSVWMIKVALVVGGSGASAIALGFNELFSTQPSTLVAVAILGSVMALVGGVAVSYLEEDAAVVIVRAEDEIRKSERLIATAAQTNHEFDDYLEAQENAILRMNALYVASAAGRELFESALASELEGPSGARGTEATKSKNFEETLLETLLKNTFRTLSIALNFSAEAYWTICVHKLVDDPNMGQVLKCVHHRRAVECDIGDARPWPIGVGVVGSAFAKNDEVVVPDTQHPAAGNVFKIRDDRLQKPEDNERYRSLFAVPICIGDSDEPWGVVSATTSDPEHFEGIQNGGQEHEEPVRALAGMIDLALAIVQEATREAAITTKSNTTSRGRTENPTKKGGKAT